MIYDNGGPKGLTAANKTAIQWEKWWPHLRAKGGSDVLTRRNSGDMVLVLAFFSCWADQVQLHPGKDGAKAAELVKALDELTAYLKVKGRKRRASALLTGGLETSKRSRTIM
jgi:hypothetical protein